MYHKKCNYFFNSLHDTNAYCNFLVITKSQKDKNTKCRELSLSLWSTMDKLGKKLFPWLPGAGDSRAHVHHNLGDSSVSMVAAGLIQGDVNHLVLPQYETNFVKIHMIHWKSIFFIYRFI